jgi:hypothetical protein
MSAPSAFSPVEPDLLAVLDELRTLEPIFHNKRFGTSTADFTRMTAPDFWEVGASGRRYGREFILEEFSIHPPVDGDDAGWTCSDFGVRRLGPDTFLLTYVLDQAGRPTRRATIWRRADDGWKVLYHQGTVIAASK